MRATGFCVIHAIAVMGVSWAARGGEPPAPKPLVLHTRLREVAPAGGGVHGQGEDPGMGAGEDGACHLRYVGPALVQGGGARGGELAPAMNRAVKAAHDRGVLIIHAPSSCLEAYKDHPARKRRRPRKPPTCPRTSTAGAPRYRLKNAESTRSTRLRAVATTGRGARKAHPGLLKIRQLRARDVPPILFRLSTRWRSKPTRPQLDRRFGVWTPKCCPACS